MLRLNTKWQAGQTFNRLGVLGGDRNGLPERSPAAGRRRRHRPAGRRRRAQGHAERPGDGVNANDKPFCSTFPFLGLPDSGSITKTRQPVARLTAPASSGAFRQVPARRSRRNAPLDRRDPLDPLVPARQEGTSHATAAPARAARHRRPRPRGRRHPRRHRAARRHVGRRATTSRPPRGRRPRPPPPSTRPPLAGARRRPDRHPAGPAADTSPKDHRAWSTLVAGLRRAGPHHGRPHLLPQGRPGPGPRRARSPPRLGDAHRPRHPGRRPPRLPPRRCASPTPRWRSTPTARRRGHPLRRADRARPLRRGAAAPRTAPTTSTPARRPSPGSPTRPSCAATWPAPPG